MTDILLVDDERTIRDSLSRLLREAGFAVRVARQICRGGDCEKALSVEDLLKGDVDPRDEAVVELGRVALRVEARDVVHSAAPARAHVGAVLPRAVAANPLVVGEKYWIDAAKTRLVAGVAEPLELGPREDVATDGREVAALELAAPVVDAELSRDKAVGILRRVEVVKLADEGKDVRRILAEHRDEARTPDEDALPERCIDVVALEVRSLLGFVKLFAYHAPRIRERGDLARMTVPNSAWHARLPRFGVWQRLVLDRLAHEGVVLEERRRTIGPEELVFPRRGVFIRKRPRRGKGKQQTRSLRLHAVNDTIRTWQRQGRGGSRSRLRSARVDDVEREIGGDEGNVGEIDGAQPELRPFDNVRGNSAKIANDHDDHEVRRLPVDALRLVCAPDRKRPREAEGEQHRELEYFSSHIL